MPASALAAATSGDGLPLCAAARDRCRAVLLGAQWVEATLQAVRAQTYPHIELLLLVDGTFASHDRMVAQMRAPMVPSSSRSPTPA